LSVSPADLLALERALALAGEGVGEVEPNPPVGAVLYRGNEFLAEGYHRIYGGLHAERDLLSRVASVPADASLAVTLEPCSTVAKQPPCTEAILAAGVRRVVVGAVDPDPRHRGRGLDLLRERDVEVVIAPEQSGITALLAEFRAHLGRSRPYVLLKWAMTLDGSWGPRTGDERGISGPESLAEVHRLRAHVDGILVGSGTVRTDDPLLTARPPGSLPLTRVVLDPRGRVPADCQLFRSADQGRVLWITGGGPASPPPGVELLVLEDPRDLAGELLPRLRESGLCRLLVEGGPTVAAAFLRAGVVDRGLVFVAPRIYTGEAAGGPRLELTGSSPAPAAPREVGRPKVQSVRTLGCDALFKLSWFS
jgi:diaminohydroxyphosphoribosylaminopyrimidine deaminase/5-amino-6-(5-phosphoribosylamino)uracil reductase